jgi:hypothetical protein
MSPTSKTYIIEEIFASRWNDKLGQLSSSSVSLIDVQKAIRKYSKNHPKEKLSSRNPANFFKDFVRKTKSANENWPNSVLQKGYTARQVTGGGNCFEFVRLKPGQTDPFIVTIIKPGKGAKTHKIQSVSMPLASRKLGRDDESWLIQVLAKLHIIETHISIYSKSKIVQIDLLQTNIKLSMAEIDSLYLGIGKPSGDTATKDDETIISCEAKGSKDDILEDQIVSQVKAIFTMKGITQEKVIPMAAKIVGKSKIYIVQFKTITRSESNNVESLLKESEALYELVPDVPGIG